MRHFFCALALLSAGLAVSPHETRAETPTPCSGVDVTRGSDIQALMDFHGEGATFCLEKGVHRITETLTPRSGQRLIGEPGAILNGSRLIPNNSVRKSGRFWVVPNVTPLGRFAAPDGVGPCRPYAQQKNAPGSCIYPDQVFIGNRPMRQELRLDAVKKREFFLDRAERKIYLPGNPEGRKIEVSVTREAIAGYTSDVTVSGLVIEKFANALQTGAIASGDSWIIEHNEVRLNNGIGIFSGAGNLLFDNYVHHNGQLGLAGQGAGIVVDSNEISYNNTNGVNWAWEGGGAKWVRTTELVVKNNHTHHNQGPGMWTDGYNVDTLYDGNRIEDNLVQGLIHEISYDAIIRNNVVRRNGFGHEAKHAYWGGGIEVWQSPNVEIYGNVVKYNAHGIMAMMTPRGSGPQGVLEVRNLFVHNNEITLSNPNGRSGLAVYGDSGNEYFNVKNNRFEDNTYWLADHHAGSHFTWKKQYISPKQWRDFGNDRTGRFRENG